MKKVLITRKLLKSNEEYASGIFNVKLNEKDQSLTKQEEPPYWDWFQIPYPYTYT